MAFDNTIAREKKKSMKRAVDINQEYREKKEEKKRGGPSAVVIVQNPGIYRKGEGGGANRLFQSGRGGKKKKSLEGYSAPTMEAPRTRRKGEGQ